MATCGTCKANKVCNHDLYGFENCNNYISADAVEVVRCKDCAKKVDYKGRIMCSKNARVICGELCGLTATHNEHFCNYGERRDT